MEFGTENEDVTLLVSMIVEVKIELGTENENVTLLVSYTMSVEVEVEVGTKNKGVTVLVSMTENSVGNDVTVVVTKTSEDAVVVKTAEFNVNVVAKTAEDDVAVVDEDVLLHELRQEEVSSLSQGGKPCGVELVDIVRGLLTARKQKMTMVINSMATKDYMVQSWGLLSNVLFVDVVVKQLRGNSIILSDNMTMKTYLIPVTLLSSLLCELV
jgi:hypothetical protein